MTDIQPTKDWLTTLVTALERHHLNIAEQIVRNYPDEVLAAIRAETAKNSGEPVGSFQDRVQPWMMACFGAEISADKMERNHRFLEEALELVQASGCTPSEAHQLVDYVYGRPQGDINQEVGGVMVTLAAHCLAHGTDMHEAAETELARIWTKVEVIRAKQAAKPKNSPLPASATPANSRAEAIGAVLAKDLELISGLIEGYDHVGTGSSKYAARDAKEADEAMKRIRSALLQQKGE